MPLPRRFLLLLAVAIVAGAFGLAQPGPSEAAAFVVTKTADTNDGECSASDCSLREAVIAANEAPGPDIIWLSAGTYTLTLTGPGEDNAASGDLDITDDLIIKNFARDAIVDGNGADRVFDVAAGVTADIHLLVIRNGSAPEGGAIRNAGELKLVEVILRENAATPGTTANGGAVSNSGTLVLEGTWVGLNTATGSGGGLHNTGDLTLIHGPFQRTFVHENSAAVNGGGINHVGETLSVDNSTINGNTSSGSATGGGGILAEAGEVTITMSRVVANLAAKNGGGINVRPNAIVTITDSTLRVNSANTGGAIAVDGDVTLTRSSVHDNIATGDGGGATVGALLSATNSTFSRNGAADRGGGVVVRSGGVLTLNYATVVGNVAVEGGGLRVLNGGVAELQNTIVGGNTGGGDCAGAVRSSSNSLDSDGTCRLQDPGDQSNTDPLLGPLQDNGGPTLTHALLGGSPAIAAAAPTTAPAIDQRGVPRPPSAADIGAFERNLIDLSVTLEWTLQELAPDFLVTILRVEIRNEGPDAAGPSFVDVELPEDADVVESSESCNAGSGGLHCVVEELATGASAAFEALVIARFGTRVAFATATGTGEEQDPADNTTELTTEFRGLVDLRGEWNLVGWQGGSLDVVEAATSIAPQLAALFVFDSATQSFLGYRPGLPSTFNSLRTLEPGQGVWLRIDDNDPAVWEQTRGELIPAVQLRSGANMVAWLGRNRIPVADAVASLGDSLDRLFTCSPGLPPLRQTHRPAPGATLARRLPPHLPLRRPSPGLRLPLEPPPHSVT